MKPIINESNKQDILLKEKLELDNLIKKNNFNLLNQDVINQSHILDNVIFEIISNRLRKT